MRKCLIIFSLTIFSVLVAISQQQYAGCNGHQNQLPVLSATPSLISRVQNGEKYIWTNGTKNFVYIVKVKGTPYQMGFAYGQLMKEEVTNNIDIMLDFMTEQFSAKFIKMKIPKFLANMFAIIGVQTFRGLIQLNWLVAQPYTPERFAEEMRGIADGSGYPYHTIVEANMLPETTRAACTIVGAWDQATVGNNLYQLRALDWVANAPINKYPSITVYHPNDGFIFANIGYAGCIFALTAFSQKQIAISQKVWMPTPKNNSIHWTYVGTPWGFMLRDIAQFAYDIQSAVNMMYNTNRTILNSYGIGSGQSRSFEGIEESSNVLFTYTDKNYTYYSPVHPQLDGVFFLDKHPQPSNHPCLGNILKQNWGHIDAATLYRDVTGFSETGSTQICVYDIYNDIIYLSYSEPDTNVPAYLRSVMYIDLKPFWTFSEEKQQEN